MNDADANPYGAGKSSNENNVLRPKKIESL
jgi:hypothetical protein